MSGAHFKVTAISMMRDEEDIARATVSWMQTQVDEVIIADNGSKDSTRAILEELGVIVVDDPEPGYFQAAKMTVLARTAGRGGATWIVPFDADEIWYSPFGPRIADVLAAVPEQWLVAAAQLFDHVATGVDPSATDEPNAVRRIGWRRRDPAPLPKVAVRWREDLAIDQGNHRAFYDGGATVLPGRLVVRHFPYRSAEQFVRKAKNGAAAYLAAGAALPPDAGAHWRSYGAIAAVQGDEACAEIFRTWFYVADPHADVVGSDGVTRPSSLIYDPAPQCAPLAAEPAAPKLDDPVDVVDTALTTVSEGSSHVESIEPKSTEPK